MEGSTPTFFFFLFVFSSTSRVLSPLLRGGGCNRPMVYYYSSSLLYSIALRRLRLFNRSTTLSLFAFLFLPSPSSPSGSHFSPSSSPSLPLSTACLCATQGQSLSLFRSRKQATSELGSQRVSAFLLDCALTPSSSRRLPLPLSLSQRLVCVLPKLRYIEPHRRLDSYSHLRVLRRALLHLVSGPHVVPSSPPHRPLFHPADLFLRRHVVST